MVQYAILNKKKIIYMLIKEFKNELAALNRILSHKNQIQEIRGLNLKRDEHAKDELYNLKEERDEEMELLKEQLKFLTLRNRYLGRSNDYEEEIEMEE